MNLRTQRAAQQLMELNLLVESVFKCFVVQDYICLHHQGCQIDEVALLICRVLIYLHGFSQVQHTKEFWLLGLFLWKCRNVLSDLSYYA